MRGCIKACDGVTHIDQAQQERKGYAFGAEWNHGTACITRKVCEGPQAREIQLHRAESEQSNDEDDRECQDEVTTHICHFGCQLNAIVIQKCLRNQYNCQEHELVPIPPGGCIHFQGIGEKNPLKENRIQQYIDGGNHTDQPNQVKPGSRPTPHLSAEMGTPVIETTCGREGGSDLSHTKGNTEGKYSAHQPNHERAARTQCIERSRESGDTARQNTDDGKRN